MIGLLGTNPEGWRLKQLTASLDGKTQIKPLFPWLFATEVRDGSIHLTYDSIDFPVGGDEVGDDLIYVISLGFEDLQETIYKLRLLRELRDAGLTFVNSLETIETCRNKVSMTLMMTSDGVRMPRTMITESVHIALEFIRENRPCVLKPITGLRGRGLIKIPGDMRDGDVIDYVSYFQSRFGKDVIYVQEFIDHPGYDIRVLVVGDRVVSKMRRFNPESWKTNISAGAQPLPSDDDVDEIALEAARSVGGQVVGVDVLPTKEDDFYVLEVNAFPGWKGLQEVTDLCISDEIAGYLLSLL
jgi:ribosomal protein S6--L-glutamate ligase